LKQILDSLPKLAKDKHNENKKYFDKLKKKAPKNLDYVMQDLHDADHGKMLTTKQQDLLQAQTNLEKINQDLAELSLAVTAVGPLGTQPRVYYDQEADAHEHRSRLASAELNLKNKQAETDPYAEQIEEMQIQCGQQSFSIETLQISHDEHRSLI
jgi:hypothetical protein